MSGIALMLDGVIDAVEEDRIDEAKQVLGSALEKQRQTIRSLRDLSFELEPVVLRDQGFGPAVSALAQQLGMSNSIQIDLDVDAAERLTEHAQVAIFQIIREALHHAIRRGPPTRISVRVGRGLGQHRGRDLRRRARRATPRELRGARRTRAFAQRTHERRLGEGRRHGRPRRLPALQSAPLDSARMAAQSGHCLFVSKPTGYELLDREGEPPPVGSTVELDDDGSWVVNRISQSPLPQDRRPCAYLLPATS